MIDWASLSADEINHLVGGRKRHNHRRQLAAAARRKRVAPLAAQGLAQAEIARRVGCSQPTISRDVRFLGKLVDLVRQGPLLPGGQVYIRIEPHGWSHEFDYG